MFTTNLLKAITEPYSLRHSHIYAVFLIAVRFDVVIGVVGVVFVVMSFSFRAC